MNQAPVSYYPQQMVQQPCQSQLSYNAVKIDVHNPKVMDGQPMYPSPYGMPVNPYYVYPQANGTPCYPGMPQANPNIAYVPQPVYPQPQQPQPALTVPNPTPVVPAPVQPQPQPQPQPAVTVPNPVPVVPAPVQQVINNGVPTTQTIVQNPPTQTTTQVPPQTVNTNPIVQPAVDNQPQPQNTTVETAQPDTKMPAYDITPVLKGLQSNNMAEQAEALNKIGEMGEKPEELKNYLEPAVIDSLLGILHADTNGLEGPTKAQEEARAKWMKEIDLPEKDQTITPQEKQLAMTLSPKEMADKNKQHAMYSIAILQKALADEIEKTNGEKIGIEKLPAIDHIVNVVKSNPNPLLRASALVALAHLNKDEYKPVLSDIFKLAQKDQDPNVKLVATEALERINNPNAAQQK